VRVGRADESGERRDQAERRAASHGVLRQECHATSRGIRGSTLAAIKCYSIVELCYSTIEVPRSIAR